DPNAGAASYVVQGDPRGDAAPTSQASLRRGFFVRRLEAPAAKPPTPGRKTGPPSASRGTFSMAPRYEPREIEPKWQRVWEDERAFHVPNPVPDAPTPENHWYQ